MTSDEAMRITELEHAVQRALAGDLRPAERYVAMQALAGAQREVLAPSFTIQPGDKNAMTSPQASCVAELFFSRPAGWCIYRVCRNNTPLFDASGAATPAAELILPMHLKTGDVVDISLVNSMKADLCSLSLVGYRIDDEDNQ